MKPTTPPSSAVGVDFTYDATTLTESHSQAFLLLMSVWSLDLMQQLRRQNYLVEVCVFSGASYFCAVAKAQVYGLSARGFAVDIGEPIRRRTPAPTA